MSPPRARRTQQERREATIGKLVAAAIESILAVGYAATTVKEICRRARLSHGALFRFFPTLLDLTLAAAEEVGRRQIAEFERRFAAIDGGEDPLDAALGLLRDACRSPTNTVFYELLIAARTDAALRRALEPGIRRYFDAIRDAARLVPGVEALPQEALDALLFAAIHLFDGEALVRIVLPRPDAEEARMAMLKMAIGLFTRRSG